MVRGKITKRTIEAIPVGPKDVLLWDTELRGFGCKVTPRGKRVFLVKYQVPHRHRVARWVTIGVLGPMTVDLARDEAKRILGRVARGEDPGRERAVAQRAAKNDTVERLFADYLASISSRCKPSTLELYKSFGQRYLLPALGKKPIASVTASDVAELHQSLRQVAVTANRVGRLVRSFYFWLERRELFTGKNPARSMDWFPEQGRERFLTVEEMTRLGQALRVAETVGLPPAPEHQKPPGVKRARNAGMFASGPQPANPAAVSALRFLMFTGWREQEALTLRWDDVNFEAGYATLGDTKTGRSTRPLGAPALELVSAQPRHHESPYVFPGRNPTQSLREIRRLWYAVRHAANLRDVRLHDLRHSVASFAGSHGYSLFLIGKLLGHKTTQSTERYAHLADDARKLAADTVASAIDTALRGGQPTPVTPLKAVK